MGSSTPSFTLKEGIAVLDEALSLLATPEQWTTGAWKCAIFKRDPKTGFIKYDEDGNAVQKTDKQNRPMYAYCIEGAVNQAVINKFGAVRAKALGALSPVAPKAEDTSSYTNEEISGPQACDLLSVNDITRELYRDEWFDIQSIERPAQSVNDDRENSCRGRGGEGYGYEDVIRILTTRRQRMVDALRQKTGG